MIGALSSQQQAQFDRDGFVVLRGVFSPEALAPAVETITGFAQADLGDPATWYRLSPDSWSVVPLHHPQAFWDLRQDPRLVAPFAALLGTDRLWVTMDRASFKPPLSAAHPRHRQQTDVHWDEDPRESVARSLQGLVYLTDVGPGDGGFECVPSLYRELPGWLARNPLAKKPEVTGRELLQVEGQAGDVIIWSSKLPHRGGVNHGRTPRLAFYVSYTPEGSEAERAERISLWERKRAPAAWRGWVNQPDPEPGPPATLTPLGRRLLGSDRYER